MTWILRKESRELGPALVLLTLAMFVAGISLVTEMRAAESYLWSCAGAGLLLGAFQVWRDLVAENDAFLRHRAMSWTAIRVARAATGLAGGALLAVVPWLPLLLVPGSHGYDIWSDAPDVAVVGDLTLGALPLGAAIAVFWWSLARLGGSVRHPRLRPFAAVVLLVVGFLATQSRDSGATDVLLVLGTVAATCSVVFPARETVGESALRLVRPAALLGLVIVAATWLEASTWLRVAGRSTLWQAYPALIASDTGELRYVRTSRTEDRRVHVREWNVDRSEVLRDEIVTDREYGRAARHLGFAHRQKSAATRRLEDGAMRALTPWPRSDLPLVATASPGGLVGWMRGGGDRATGIASLLEVRLEAGRFVVAERRWAEVVPQGSFGPDGWRSQASGDAPGFSDTAWASGYSSVSRLSEGRQLVIVDPERRAAYVVERVQGEAGERADPPFTVTERSLPDEAVGPIRPLSQFILQPQTRGVAAAWRNVLHLRCDSGLVLLDIDDGTSSVVPLEPGEDFGSWVPGFIDPAAPVYAVARPPFRDTASRIRVRAQVGDASEMTVTDLVLAPKDPLERLAAGLLGAVTLARPPLLNVASFAAPAPQSFDELDGRRLLDGTIAGGDGAPWLIGSLIVGALCALRNRRQARLRCESAGEKHAWTAVGFALGPMGIVWMSMLVRRSAVRTTEDGIDLAVHVPASWPAPATTGREVLLGA